MQEYNLNGDGTTPSFSKLAENRPKNGLEAAVLYMRMGLPTVPCEGKRPTVKDWPKCWLVLEDLPRHFGNGQNIGLLLGERSGGLVVVDIDVPEALPIADWFLEDTLCAGRASCPRAHHYYRVPGLKNKKWLDTDGTVLLELRSTGSQTLAEPSKHPSTGECYAWDREGLLEAVEVDANELHKRCAEFATATVVARHVPAGGRHEYAKAVIGYLLRRLEKEATLKIVRAAWRAADADGGDALRDLDGIASDTERRLVDGANAFGGPNLDEMVLGLPKLLARWWGWEDPEQGKRGALGRTKRSPRPTTSSGIGGWGSTPAMPTG